MLGNLRVLHAHHVPAVSSSLPRSPDDGSNSYAERRTSDVKNAFDEYKDLVRVSLELRTRHLSGRRATRTTVVDISLVSRPVYNFYMNYNLEE